MKDLKVLKDDYRSLVETDGEYVVKRFKYLEREENNQLFGKLEIGTKIKIEGLVTPIGFTCKNGKVDEVYYPFVSGRNFADLLSESGFNLPLDVIIDYMENIERIVQLGHSQEQKIIFPDLLTEGNILYDEGTGKVNIVDFDGLQVGNYESGGISDFIFNSNTSSLLLSSKYYRDGLFTKNVDLFSIYVYLVYYSTKMRLPADPQLKENLLDHLSIAGILGTDAGQKIMNLFNPQQDNDYLGDSFRQLKENYILTDSVPKQPRQYVRK